MKSVTNKIASACIRALNPALRQTIGNHPSGLRLNSLFHTDFFDDQDHYAETDDPIEPHNFGELYEEFLSISQQKGDGIFYTPALFVEGLVKRVLSGNEKSKLTILDPACGGGAFLIQAFSYLCSDTDPLQVITNSIYGVDRDPIAVKISRLALQVTLLQNFKTHSIPDLSTNIKCGDALIGPRESGEPTSFDWLNEFPRIMAKGGFDVVIGNPPYGISRDRQISQEENVILKRAYAIYRKGKVNKYILFIAKALALVQPKSGKISFVVPNAWLGISGGEPLRKLLLEKECIDSVIVHDYPVFKDPNVEVVSFVIKFGSKNKSISIEREIAPGKFSSSMVLDYSLCRSNPGSVIPTTWNSDTPTFISEFAADSTPLSELSDYFKPMIALQAYAVGKGQPPQTEAIVESRPFDKQRKESEHCYPYLQGSDVKRFSIEWSGTFLEYGPWLAEPQNIERFSAPRIVIREVLAKPPFRIQAALVTETMLYNKSILHILAGPKATKAHLENLLTFINSEPTSRYITYRGRKSQRAIFPKLVLEDLLSLPIPNKLLPNGLN